MQNCNSSNLSQLNKIFVIPWYIYTHNNRDVYIYLLQTHIISSVCLHIVNNVTTHEDSGLNQFV